MVGRALSSFAVLLALVIVPACGGDDDGGTGGGSEDPVAAIESCLEDAGLDVRDNELDPELVADGATHQFLALDVNQQEYGYDVTVFSAPDKAAAWARDQQRENTQQPQLKFQTESFGSNAVTTTSDAPKREDVQSCAEENG